MQAPLSLRNIGGRLIVTTIYCAILTLIGCMMPFFGDFLALVGGPRGMRACCARCACGAA